MAGRTLGWKAGGVAAKIGVAFGNRLERPMAADWPASGRRMEIESQKTNKGIDDAAWGF